MQFIQSFMFCSYFYLCIESVIFNYYNPSEICFLDFVTFQQQSGNSSPWYLGKDVLGKAEFNIIVSEGYQINTYPYVTL